MRKPKPVGVKITRCERRNRKIIIVIEPDLFSHEVFAVNPFYNEGDAKNQLQDVKFCLSVKECKGVVEASIGFSGSHSTTGHTQIHDGVGKQFIDRKDAAIAWTINTDEEWLTEDRFLQILAMWDDDKDFQKEFTEAYAARKTALSDARRKILTTNYQQALQELDSFLARLIS